MGKPWQGVFALASILMIGSARPGAAANATVNISDYMFTDTASGTSITTINAGESVTWNWQQYTHSTTSGTCTNGGGAYGEPGCTADGNWDSQRQTAPHTFTHTFPTAGSFSYFCLVHGSQMTGKVIVNAVVPPPPPPPPPPVPSVCIPSATVLCIDDQPGDKRFEVEASFSTARNGGQSGDGQVIPLSSLGVTHGGILWFFSADNPELLVKVLNTCSFSSRIWVFASAGTDVGVILTITDTKTGTQKIYTNTDGTPMDPIQDTAAFATCP